MKCVISSRSSLFARRDTFMPKQYKWFINYIFRKKYLSAHMITVLISYPPKSVLLSIYFHNVSKKRFVGFPWVVTSTGP